MAYRHADIIVRIEQYEKEAEDQVAGASRLGEDIEEVAEVPMRERFVDVRSLWLEPVKLGYQGLSADERFYVVVNSINQARLWGEGGIDGESLYKRLKRDDRGEDRGWRSEPCPVSILSKGGLTWVWPHSQFTDVYGGSRGTTTVPRLPLQSSHLLAGM
jgi:hypothetical protein